MKNKSFGLVIAACICAAGLVTNASAISTTSFGSIPGIPTSGQNPYSGGGIPYDASVNSVNTVTIGPLSDTITMSLSTTAHGSGNPTPGNDGVSTFFVNPGLVSGRSMWNWDFYINNTLPKALGSPGIGDFGYSFSITLTGPNGSGSFNPLTFIGDNVGGPNSAGNSESFDFTSFASLIGGYDPNANATYGVSLTEFQNGNELAQVSETIVAGTGISSNTSNIPETSSTAGLLGASLGVLAIVGKRKNILSAFRML